MRLIDSDALNMIKFHPLPYTHIVPADLLKCQTEAYERGWNDAIDAIIENAETIEDRKTGRWILIEKAPGFPDWICSECGGSGRGDYFYCPWCRAKMEVEHDGIQD